MCLYVCLLFICLTTDSLITVINLWLWLYLNLLICSMLTTLVTQICCGHYFFLCHHCLNHDNNWRFHGCACTCLCTRFKTSQFSAHKPQCVVCTGEGAIQFVWHISQVNMILANRGHFNLTSICVLPLLPARPSQSKYMELKSSLLQRYGMVPNQCAWDLLAICDLWDWLSSAVMDNMLRLLGSETPHFILPFLFEKSLPLPTHYTLFSHTVDGLRAFTCQANCLMADFGD